MQKFVFENKINHIRITAFFQWREFVYVLAVTTRLQVAKWHHEEVKEKRSSGEFKTILNEGKSTVWRYFCRSEFVYVLAVTTRLQVAKWHHEEVKEKRSSGEFKTILNEGKSTVWRYFCLVV